MTAVKKKSATKIAIPAARAADEQHARHMKIAREIMKKRRGALAKLAKA
jgi:hypothetical protein